MAVKVLVLGSGGPRGNHVGIDIVVVVSKRGNEVADFWTDGIGFDVELPCRIPGGAFAGQAEQ